MMFTGIIKDIGKVKEIKSNYIEIRTKFAPSVKKGASVAVNGICLTAVKIFNDAAGFDFMDETYKKTTLKNLKKGGFVNIEPALTLNDGIDGHIVTGHIDTAGKVISFIKKNNQNIVKISFDKKYKNLLAGKGSAAVDGVSLTVIDAADNWFTAGIIPETLNSTIFKYKKEGEEVNIEFDIFAKYIQNYLNNKETFKDILRKNDYI